MKIGTNSIFTSLMLFQNTRKLLHVVDKSTHAKSALAHCTTCIVKTRFDVVPPDTTTDNSTSPKVNVPGVFQ